jgi:hypothetical protein
VSLVKSEAADWDDCVYFSNDYLGSLNHVLIEVSGCSHKFKISICVSCISLNESKVSPDGVFSNVLLSIEVFNLK